jgi:hypothetical protein
LLTESLQAIHRPGGETVASSDVLHDLQPLLVLQTQALEDGLDMRRAGVPGWR